MSDEDPVQVVAAALGRPVCTVSPSGHECEIEAAAVHPRGWLAWVEREERGPSQPAGWVDIEYYLRLRIGRETRSWVVPTYNPYFGCYVGHMAWYGSRVVLIYREKHDTFAAAFGFDDQPDVERVRLADDWVVGCDGVVAYRPWGSPRIERVRLPGLRELEPLTPETARRKYGIVIPTPKDA